MEDRLTQGGKGGGGRVVRPGQAKRSLRREERRAGTAHGTSNGGRVPDMPAALRPGPGPQRRRCRRRRHVRHHARGGGRGDGGAEAGRTALRLGRRRAGGRLRLLSGSPTRSRAALKPRTPVPALAPLARPTGATQSLE